MPNPYHDETGRFCSAGEMSAAVDRLVSENRFEEAFKLSNEYHAASKSELEATIAEMKDFGVPQPVAAASVGSKAPVTRSAKKPAAVQTPQPAGNAFALPAKHTYRPEGVTPGDGDAYYSRKFTGNKVKDDGYRSVTEISKDLRSDFAEAQAKGYLPKNLAFSVVSSKYSGGQSLRVRIQGGNDKDLFITGSEDVRPEYGRQIYTDEATEVLKRAQGIVDAYRWDASEPQVDYFNTNFYGFVDIESERSAAFREKEAAADRIKREGYKQRKEVLAKPQAQQEALFASHATKATKDTTGSYGFIPGTQLLVVEGDAERYSYGGRTTHHVKEMYDLTGYTPRRGAKLNDELAEMDLSVMRAVLSKQKFFPPKERKTRR